MIAEKEEDVMNRNENKRIKGLLAVLFALCICLMTACAVPIDEREVLSEALGADISSGEIQTYTDSHGGFHGDGETYAEVVFSDDDFLNAIENDAQWCALPLTQNLSAIVYGGMTSNGTTWAPSITNDEDELLVPTISNGYYFFKDRHYESEDAKDDSSLFDRYSMNFTIAIYDSDTKILYFYKLDT